VFTQLLILFGGFALVLASIGLHGVTAYSVARRTSEIGVRVAVGSRPAQILASVLRQVLVLALVGVVVGVPIALAASPLVESLLYGVAPTDPLAAGEPRR
jgi:ABC-type antimicrobial peptide transport system permease subunit